MSSETSSTLVSLKKKDPISVSTEVRAQMHLGSVLGMVVDLVEGKLFVERPAAVQKEIDLRAQQADAMEQVVDPVEVVLGEEISELRVTGMSVREAMFTAMQIAMERGSYVAYWACGNIEYFARISGFKLPLMKSDKLLVLGVPVVESKGVGWDQMIVCLAAIRDALPVEVEKGLLIALEDVNDAKPSGRSAPVVGTRSESGHRAPEERGPVEPTRSAPVWFGPSS